MEISTTELNEIIQQSVAQAIRQMNLDNRIDCADECTLESSCPEGGTDMGSKVRKTITLNNGQTITLRGQTLEDAIRRLCDAVGSRSADTPTFRDYATKWVTVYHDPKSGTRWREETQNLLNKHIFPYFGDLPLGDITVEHIQMFYNSKSQYARSTIKHMKYLLRNILDSAVEDHLIPGNVTLSKRLSFSTRETERKPLTEEQVMDVKQQIQALSERDRLFITLLLYTGVRRGEAMALRWEDVDLKKMVLHIRHSVEYVQHNTPVLKKPKSKAGIRDIPISQELLPLLQSQMPSDHKLFVFSGTDQPLTKSAYQWMFNGIRKRVNLHGATPHVLRHTFVTAAAGHLDPKQLQEIAGHSKCDITLNRYAHTQYKNTAQTAEDLADLYVELPQIAPTEAAQTVAP